MSADGPLDMRMTTLERAVATSLAHRRDPWHGYGGVGLRKVSAALHRLESKGIAEIRGGAWYLTTAGRAALELGASTGATGGAA